MILCYALALHAPWLIRRRSGCCSALGLVRRDFVMLFFLQGNFARLNVTMLAPRWNCMPRQYGSW